MKGCPSLSFGTTSTGPERAAYARAVSARDSTALDQVSRDFEDLGAILCAAEAEAEAAVVLRRAGKARQATAAERKAARLLARCASRPQSSTPPCRPLQQADRRRHGSVGSNRRKPFTGSTRSSGSPGATSWP